MRDRPQKPMYAGLPVPLQGGRLLLGRCTQGSETVLPDLSKVRRTSGPWRSVRLHKKKGVPSVAAPRTQINKKITTLIVQQIGGNFNDKN